MIKQKTIGRNPLEDYLSSKEPKESKETTGASEQRVPEPHSSPLLTAPLPAAQLSTAQQSAALQFAAQQPVAPQQTAQPFNTQHAVEAEAAELNATKSSSSLKQRITLYISADVIDKVKDAVYWEPGLTLAAFSEEALYNALISLEAERGKPFPPRKERKLRGGRPLS